MIWSYLGPSSSYVLNIFGECQNHFINTKSSSSSSFLSLHNYCLRHSFITYPHTTETEESSFIRNGRQ
ncbi:hypothetical protein AtEden1_Chr3g0158651 [Arabidopsis thaliana]